VWYEWCGGGQRAVGVLSVVWLRWHAMHVIVSHDRAETPQQQQQQQQWPAPRRK